MVGVDQLVQIVSGLGMVFIDVRDLRVGLFVDEIIEKIGNCHAKSDGAHRKAQARVGLDGLCHQIEADHAEHNAAGKAQKQAHRPLGIFL